MREIISEQAFNHAVSWLAIIGPVGGAAVGAAVGFAGKSGMRTAWKGLAIGGLGVLNWALWRVYNLITNELGLSSVNNLVAQIGVFAALGIGAGILYAIFLAKPRQT